MPRLLTFWYWGTETPSVTAPTPPVWTKLASVAQHWVKGGVDVVPRFEHVYPIAASGFGRTVSYEFKVQSQFPAVIDTNGAMVIESTITVPPV